MNTRCNICGGTLRNHKPDCAIFKVASTEVTSGQEVTLNTEAVRDAIKILAPQYSYRYFDRHFRHYERLDFPHRVGIAVATAGD